MLIHRGFILLMVSAAGALPIPECGSDSGPSEGGVELRLVKSRDGIRFDGEGQTWLAGGRSPVLACLPNGRLAALFTYGSGVRPGASMLLVSFSSDAGASWSEPELVRVSDARDRTMIVRGGALARGPDGQVRLYFVGWSVEPTTSRPADTQPTTESASEAVVFAAVTKDGVNYRVEGATPLPIDAGAGIQLAAAAGDKQVDLYVTVRTESQGQSRREVLRLVSRDGRRFTRMDVRDAGLGAADSVVRAGKQGWRVYVSAEDGIHSLISGDGLRWKPEEGVRLAGGFDPAVVQLADGTFVMVYCARSAGPTGGLGPPAGAAAEAGQKSGQPQEAAAVVVDGQAAGSEQAGGASADPLSGSVADIGTNEGVYPDRPGGEAGQQVAETVGSDESAEQIIEALMPPRPDFVNHVDYLSWLQERYPDNIENNAQDAYLALMPHGVIGGGPAPDWWPRAFNDAFYDNKPGPWLPEEHPDWEAAHQALQWPLEAFRAATLLPSYAGHYDFGGSDDPTPPEERMVYEILLPGLANCRNMVKAALADGWRVENGRVDPERMIESWTTTLGNADHLGQGFSVIEDLVGVAEQMLVQEQARLALQHGVFQTAEEMEKALNVLKDHDRQVMDQPRWVSCEAAGAFQVTQYVFTPAAPDGQPQINVERLKQLLPSITAGSEEELARFSQMKPADAFKTLDALERYYRELTRNWQVGYPQMREADMATLEMSTAYTTEITKTFLPSVSRVYHLSARNETSRRATQLTYEVHLFKARNGRWPSSLDELGVPFGDRTRTDPFTGGDFGYRLDEAGPTIYSLSENGRDDGGVHSPRWADNVKSDADSDDYVFWPPQ